VSRFGGLAASLVLAVVAASAAAPAGASASFVARESAQGYATFAGETCGSTSTRSLQLPARAYDVTPTALPLGSVLHSSDDDLTPVARISAVASDPGAHTVRWTATGSDESCAAPADPALDPELVDAYPIGPWETSGDDLGAGYSMRVTRVFLPARCGGPHYRPTRIVVACGDGNLQLPSLRWTHWNDRAATARGVVWANDCIPFCAAGRFHRYAARVRASQPARCRGVYQYLHLRYRLLHRAHGVARTGRMSLGWTCREPRRDLLEHPAVAVRVAERGERAVAGVLGGPPPPATRATRRTPSPGPRRRRGGRRPRASVHGARRAVPAGRSLFTIGGGHCGLRRFGCDQRRASGR
jgi:hypothetical protein